MRSGSAVLRGVGAAALLAAALGSRPATAQSFAISAGGSIATDQGSIQSLRGFDYWATYLAGEVKLEPNVFLQLRWTHMTLPGSQENAPEKLSDSGNMIAGYLFQESWFRSGIFLGLGYYHISPKSPDEGEVAVDADEDVFGWTAGLMAAIDIGRRWDVRMEVSGHYIRTDTPHKPILFTLGLAYKF